MSKYNLEKGRKKEKNVNICDKDYKNRGERNGKQDRSNIWRNNDWEFPKPDETYQPTFKKL